MNKRVIAAGHICIDITPVFPERAVSDISDILRPGQLIQMGKAEVSIHMCPAAITLLFIAFPPLILKKEVTYI